MADTYARWVDSLNPSAIVFLIDQSESMKDAIASGGGSSKADAVAEAINRALSNLVTRASRGEVVKPYLDIAVIGYGATVDSAWGGNLAGREWVSLPDIADNAVRTAQVSREGRMATEPFWFEPVARGMTPMCAAMGRARRMLTEWLGGQRQKRSNLDILPPIVVNITDGDSTDGSPQAIAEEIRSLETDDGHVLVFNCHITHLAATAVKYPDTPAALPDSLARSLFEMSSALPASFRKHVESPTQTLSGMARGMVFNADLRELSDFIDMGTRDNRLR
jgi:hypothetical protein